MSEESNSCCTGQEQSGGVAKVPFMDFRTSTFPATDLSPRMPSNATAAVATVA
jgi:hypothetical protein